MRLASVAGRWKERDEMNANLHTVPSGFWIALGSIAGGLLLLLLRGRLGHSLLDLLERVQRACSELAHKALHLGGFFRRHKRVSGEAAVEKDEGEGEYDSTGAEVLMIITRLLGGFLALDIVLAMLAIDSTSVGGVITGQDSPGLAGAIDISVVFGLLGWAMTAMGFAFMIEVVIGELPPAFSYMWPIWRKRRAARIFFGFMSSIGLIAALGYMVLVAVVRQLELQKIPWPAANLVVVLCLFIAANVVGGLSLWALTLGIGAAFALICLVVRLIAMILQALLRAWVRPEKVPLIGQLPENGNDKHDSFASTGTTDVPKERVLPAGTISPYKTSVVTAGNFGQRVMLLLAKGLSDLQAKGAMRSGGYIPTGQTPDGIIDKMIRDSGAKVISTTPRDWAIARSGPGNELETLFDQACTKLERVTPALAGEELTLFTLGYEQVQALREPLTRFHAAMKRQVVVLVVELPVKRLGREDVRAALIEAEALWRDQIVAMTVLVDREKPYKAQQSREEQERLLTHSLNGLMVAHDHFNGNRTGAEFFQELGKVSPFLGVATGTVVLQPGEQLKAFDPGRWAHGDKRGRGNVELAREKLTGLGAQLLTDASSCLFPMPIQDHPELLGGEVFTVFAKNDPGYRSVREGIEQWAAASHQGTPLVFVAGPGALSASADKHYQAQWTWWYGFSLDDFFTQLGPTNGTKALPAAASRGASLAPRSGGASSPSRGSQGGRLRAAGSDEKTAATRPVSPGKRGRRTPLRLV